MKSSLTSCWVASSVPCGSGSSVSSSPTTSTLMKSDIPAARGAARQTLVRAVFSGAVDQSRPQCPPADDEGIVGIRSAADEVDELQLVPGVDDGFGEIILPPDLTVVLDHHAGWRHIELLEKIEQAHAVRDLARLAVDRDGHVAHRRATSSLVTISSCRRRAASAGSTAS